MGESVRIGLDFENEACANSSSVTTGSCEQLLDEIEKEGGGDDSSTSDACGAWDVRIFDASECFQQAAGPGAEGAKPVLGNVADDEDITSPIVLIDGVDILTTFSIASSSSITSHSSSRCISP